jgi:hypothetical protein
MAVPISPPKSEADQVFKPGRRWIFQKVQFVKAFD